MYQGLKGFRELYPEEMAARRTVIDTVEGVARRHGFREVATPYLERAEMWTDKAGDEIVDELYAFTDKGDRLVTLTPELTPTVARMVVERQQALSKPIKWYSTRPFWRYEQVQQGRFREFYQCNVDTFGTADPRADAEIIAVAAEMLRELGVPAADFELRISHRDILGGVFAATGDGVDTEMAIRAVDRANKVEEAEYYRLLEDAGLDRDAAEQIDGLLAAGDLEAIGAFAQSDRVDAAIENLQAILAELERLGVRDACTIALDTARGLDYYTGVVFECFDPKGRVSRSVFGGGRYDELIEQFGGQPTPAVGFAPGVMNSTLPLLLQAVGVFPAETLRTDYYVLSAGESDQVRDVVGEIAGQLRALDQVVETDLTGRGFGSQMGYADTINAERVIIVGERDLADGAVTLKEMASGEQTQIPLSAFPPTEGPPTIDAYSD
jgi:histidyl-tRNA synthetase